MARTGLSEIFAVANSGALTDAEFAAWILIRSFEDPTQGCTAGQATLAERRGVSTRQWRRLKDKLEGKGYLSCRWRGPTTQALRTTLPEQSKGRTSDVRARADAERPGKGGRQTSGQTKRADAWADAWADGGCPVRDGEMEKTPSSNLNSKKLERIIRKVISDGTAHRFDAYRTRPGFLEERATRYGLPANELREIYADIERNSLIKMPERELIESVLYRARARMDGRQPAASRPDRKGPQYGRRRRE